MLPFRAIQSPAFCPHPLSTIQLAELTGAYGKVNHGGAVANWEAGRSIPSKAQYNKIRDVLQEAGAEGIPDYEDIIRPFNVNQDVEFTDVWTYENVRQYKGKHPAEKPVDLLENAIKATTYEGDIVLDCFSGSGSTEVAAIYQLIDATQFFSSQASSNQILFNDFAWLHFPIVKLRYASFEMGTVFR